MKRLRLAVVGVGHLGKEHARILASLPEVNLVGVVDARQEQAQAVAERCRTRAFTEHTPLLTEVDAAVLAVPTQYHHPVACDFLSRGIPVLVEKPITPSLDQADHLVDLARRNGTIVQVGHIERFNPAFEALRGKPLQPKWIQARRLCPFSGRSTDVGVVLDLMIHDLDLILSLVKAPVQTVSALGMTLLGGHEDLVTAHLTFSNGCVAEVQASRIHTGAVRQMDVWAPEGMVSLDFQRKHLTLVQPSQAIRLQRVNAKRFDSATVAALRADPFGQFFSKQECDCQDSGPDALTRELLDFLQCVREGLAPRVSGEHGREALALALRIVDSVQKHRWNGQVGGPTGPSDLPLPLGSLFTPPSATPLAA